MKKIQLTQNQVVLVDDLDYESLSEFNWQALWDSKMQTYYAMRVVGRKLVMMARVILDAPKGLHVDHKNHDTLNNQRHNLRLCTHSQNHQNERPRKNTTSQYKGVSWHKQHKKWYARIGLRDVFDKKYQKTLGWFTDENQAAFAYDRAAKKHFKDFAYFNFPKQSKTQLYRQDIPDDP